MNVAVYNLKLGYKEGWNIIGHTSTFKQNNTAQKLAFKYIEEAHKGYWEMNRIIIAALVVVLTVGIALVAVLVSGPAWGFNI
jgi:hypothetical protein